MTPKEMSERCIEFTETWMAMPKAGGPAQLKSFWPEYAQDLSVAMPMEHKRVPTARQIAEADQFQDWVNGYLDEADRREIYLWGYLKVKTGATIRSHCDKYGLKEHGYRRKIMNIYQYLVSQVFGQANLSIYSAVDDAEFLGQKEAQLEKTLRYYRDFERPSVEDFHANPPEVTEADRRAILSNILVE